jgi:o-succinylbenzoate---CoA ligase
LKKTINSNNIDWLTNRAHVLLNPRLPSETIGLWEEVLNQDFPGHIWLATSGSTQMKLVALRKQAFLASAQAVNLHLNATHEDSWINPLPLFHVGGLSIYARAHLSKSPVFSYEKKWDPQGFYDFLVQKKGTLTALVPTQVYDLVIRRLKAPAGLRAVIVGGGALEESLYGEARKLGWPLLPSFGMTECCSQVATASLQSLHRMEYPRMQILSHVTLKTDMDGRVSIKSPALLSAYAILENDKIAIKQPLQEGYFLTRDFADVKGDYITIRGRVDDFIKIAGENVEMARLEKILEELKLEQRIDFDAALVAMPDERLGHVVHFFVTSENYHDLRGQFDKRVMPYEKIRKVHVLEAIPRSPLNKVLRGECVRVASSRNTKQDELVITRTHPVYHDSILFILFCVLA